MAGKACPVHDVGFQVTVDPKNRDSLNEHRVGGGGGDGTIVSSTNGKLAPQPTPPALLVTLLLRYFNGSYKWMLYGDDDTVFYLPAVKVRARDT